jgi:hypothetical protein
MRTARGRHLTKTIIAQASHVLALCVLRSEHHLSMSKSTEEITGFSMVLVASITFIFNFRTSWRLVMCPLDFYVLAAECT